MVSYSSCCLVISLTETWGFWKSCSLNNPRARVVEHPITDASQLQPWRKVRPGCCLAEVVVLLWRKACFVCSCLALVQLHNYALLFYFKASWGIQSPRPLTAAKDTECHVSDEPCRLWQPRCGSHAGSTYTGLHGHPQAPSEHRPPRRPSLWGSLSIPRTASRLFSLSQKGTELLPECWACW